MAVGSRTETDIVDGTFVHVVSIDGHFEFLIVCFGLAVASKIVTGVLQYSIVFLVDRHCTMSASLLGFRLSRAALTTMSPP